MGMTSQKVCRCTPNVVQLTSTLLAVIEGSTELGYDVSIYHMSMTRVLCNQ